MARSRWAGVLLTTTLLAGASAGFGPSGPGAKVTKEQLAYSKKMFAEGQEAMDAGDFATALAKFQEGYRYAPHLHVFTYNLASAADALGDCRTAMTYFQMFIDLVPEHAERDAAKARLDALSETCQVAVETAPVTEAGEQPETTTNSDRAKAREEREAVRALTAAYGTLRTAQQLHDAAKGPYADAPFARAARRKRKDIKRVLKLADKLGVDIDRKAFETARVPGDARSACREAQRQENRVADAMDTALEHYDSRKAYRVLGKAKTAAQRASSSFDSCR